MKTIDFEEITLRKKISTRGGGIEIDLTSLGHEGEKMSAYQNYLGGGMLGKVCANDTIRASNSFVEESLCKELDEIAEQLKQHYFNLTNPEDEEWETQNYEQNQKMPVSGF
jgi:predicted AlkP superfamily phosphohydrolase/phosphomutase